MKCCAVTVQINQAGWLKLWAHINLSSL
jgi:hypothetical protein